MPKPACVQCRRFFRPERNGIAVIEGMPSVDGAQPGTSEPENWTPYKVWFADLWRCEGCGAEIVSGWAREPLSVQHEEKFKEDVERLGTEPLQINDC